LLQQDSIREILKRLGSEGVKIQVSAFMKSMIICADDFFALFIEKSRMLRGNKGACEF
jgi:hypothetical protein